MILTEREKRWAELAFEAILSPEAGGLPPLASTDRRVFWDALAHAPPPIFGPGLRLMLAALVALPLADPRYRRPFPALTPAERADFVAGLEASPSWPLRELLASLKVLACFAWLDDPAVRARVVRP